MTTIPQYKKVFTIGCFDFCHHGHIKLLTELRNYGKEVIVGIHDDISIRQLKKLTPTQHTPLYERINHLKPYCNRIFVIPEADPSLYIGAMLDSNDTSENSIYIRGDDNINFPGKHIVEKHMTIHYTPYTQGISATKIRQDRGLK